MIERCNSLLLIENFHPLVTGFNSEKKKIKISKETKKLEYKLKIKSSPFKNTYHLLFIYIFFLLRYFTIEKYSNA